MKQTPAQRQRNGSPWSTGCLFLIIIGVILFAVFFGCTPARKMAMPDGCKPKKVEQHEMVKPEPMINRKK